MARRGWGWAVPAPAHKPRPGVPVATGSTPQPGSTYRPGFQPFQPYKPPPIPTGMYDPALDAAAGATKRGLGDLVNQIGYDPAHGIIGTQAQRDITDYNLAQGRINEAYGRGYQDLGTQLSRGNEDINSQVAALQRAATIQGQRQGQQINAAGLGYGGAALQAAAKRSANEAIAMQPLDTARSRLQADSMQQFDRMGQDTQQQLGDLALQAAPPSADNPFGGRQWQDRGIQLTQAQREATQFGIDTQREKAYQASGAGYTPPGRGTPGGMPRNEHVGPNGQHYRTVDHGGFRYRIAPDGHILRKKKL